MQINERISKNDLKGLVKDIVSIDQYKSKIDDDNNIVVLGFEVMDENAANDLSNYIETGVVEVEDTEVSESSNQDGNYMVFVELRRGQKLHDNIRSILADATRITDIETWQFDTGKVGLPKQLDELESLVPNDPLEYRRLHEDTSVADRMRFLVSY